MRHPKESAEIYGMQQSSEIGLSYLELWACKVPEARVRVRVKVSRNRG